MKTDRRAAGFALGTPDDVKAAGRAYGRSVASGVFTGRAADNRGVMPKTVRFERDGLAEALALAFAAGTRFAQGKGV